MMRQKLIPLFLSISTAIALIATKATAETVISPTSFVISPRLVNAVSTFDQANVLGSTYYFTVAIPSDAKEPLKTLTIQQREASDLIDFSLNKSVAFLGTYTNKGQPIQLKNINQDPSNHTITLEFNQGIAPGSLFSVGLKPIRNPEYEGIYLFGVTVFPQGENPQGLYLGVGRLHFYRGGDGLL